MMDAVRQVRRFSHPASGLFQRIELSERYLGELPIALAFVVERGRARLVGRYAFRRLRQMTLLEAALELRLIGPCLRARFGPAWFRSAAYRDQCDREQHEKGAL